MVMSESKSNNDKGPPMDGSDNDAIQGSWETGLRRRRGRSRSSSVTNNEDGNDESQQENNAERERSNGSNSNSRTNQNGNSRRTYANPAPESYGGNFVTGIGGAAVGGPCSGNAGGGVGVMTSPGAAGAGMGSLGYGGGAPSTPLKHPSKDTGLVAATPSSVTTAGETAESTLLSYSPLNVRRRRSSNRPEQPPSLNRQYQVLRSQILLLLGSSGLGLMLFLFYALPMAAFISLILMVSSMGLLVPVIPSVLRARYELEMQHPLGLTRYLPESLRVMLTETTLHEFMTDDTFMMENRYLMLYFMPGLEPEQLMGYINQLPARHRDALLEPGLGRMMPSVMEHLMRTDNRNGGPANGEPMQLENNVDDVSIASGLTFDRDHRMDFEENDGEEAQVSILEAVTGLHRTLAGFTLDNGSAGTPAEHPVAVQSAIAPTTNAVPMMSETHNDIQEDDDNSSIEFSIDLSANMPGIEGANAPATPEAAPANNSELRNVIVELPQQSQDDVDSNEQNGEEARQEYDLEGRILSEAASAAVANYTTQATAVAMETATEAVATTSSWIVQAGALTGLVAGGGGIMAALLSNHGMRSTSPLLVTLGVNAHSTNSASGSGDGSNVNSNDALSERQVGGYASSQWVHGLFVTSAVSFAGAGFAYLIRNRVRADIVSKREVKRLKDGADNEDNNVQP